VGERDGFDVRYAASGGLRPVAALLHVGPDGSADLYVGTSWSLPGKGPLDTVGFFARKLEPTDLEALHRALEASGIFDRPESPVPPAVPDSVIRSLVVQQSGRTAELTIPGEADPGIAEVETALQRVMAHVQTSPVRAARLDVESSRSDGGIRALLRLSNPGVEALPIMLSDPDEPSRGLLAAVSVVTGVGEVKTQEAYTAEDVARAAPHGVAPSGTSELEPGASIELPLPEVKVPRSRESLHVLVGIEFALPLEGQGIRRVSIEAQPAPLP
jgi:hypothetical protein